MKLGIIATQIADDGGGPSPFFDDLGATPGPRPDADKLGRASGTFTRTAPSTRPARAAATRAARNVSAKTPRRG